MTPPRAPMRWRPRPRRGRPTPRAGCRVAARWPGAVCALGTGALVVGLLVWPGGAAPATTAGAGSRRPPALAAAGGTPGAFIDPLAGRLGIPSEYLTLYRQAGARYGLDWTRLAAVGAVESVHGRARGAGVTSGANHRGASGPAQFLAATWDRFGVDGDGDGVRDPHDPADAIVAMASYLRASGAPEDWRGALRTYNHSEAYASAVERLAAELPARGRLTKQTVVERLHPGQQPLRCEALAHRHGRGGAESLARGGVGAQPRQRRGQRGRIARRDEHPGHAVVEDLRQPAVVCRHDAAARRGGLQRGVGQRVGLRRGDGDDVGRAVEVLDVGAKAGEAHAVADAELGGERVQVAQLGLLALPRVAGDERDRVARRVIARARGSARPGPSTDEIRPRIATTKASCGSPSAARAAPRAARAGTSGRPSCSTHACARVAELRPRRRRHAGQRLRRSQQPPVGRPVALEARVDLAQVPDVGDPRHAGSPRCRRASPTCSCG